MNTLSNSILRRSSLMYAWEQLELMAELMLVPED
jgi:hypothetical protein